MALLLLVASACGGSDHAGQGFKLSRADVEAEIRAAGPSQQGFLADRIITPAERERAFLTFVECARSQGVEIFDYMLQPRGGDTFKTRPIGGDSALRPTTSIAPIEGLNTVVATPEDEIVEACRRQHYVAVSVLYSYLNQRSAQEEQAYNEAIATCMRKKGLHVPNGATFDALVQIDRGAVNECAAPLDR